jgi:UDPglucose--hexose-1-phosphate uridylyltransferase
MSAIDGPHRRYNPLLDEWVLCSPHRLERPWQGQTEPAEREALASYDPACYLCPGNPRAGGARNPAYTSTFAFDNDFPALRPHVADDARVPAEQRARQDEQTELLVARPESGRCRVLCFSPRHDLTLAEMDVADIHRVVDAWGEEVQRLGSLDSVRYVQVFENKGAMMGCSNPHPHGQIWATASVPSRPERILASQRRYHQAHGSDLLGDYLAREIVLRERLVGENAHWVALVPFWAVWPFETMLLPRRRVADLSSLEAEERDALAEILKQLLVRYDNLFACSFPYTMGWQSRPTDGAEHASCRLHAVFFPPLLRSATIRKFLVGYEMTAEPQRDLTPEQAAACLRETSERRDKNHAS